MNRIAFSHKGYIKFGDLILESGVKLLEVFVKNRDDLSDAFIDYDVTFKERDGSVGKYNLPHGKLLILLLIDKSGTVFTTVRRYTAEKHEYYKSIRGHDIDVVFTGF